MLRHAARVARCTCATARRERPSGAPSRRLVSTRVAAPAAPAPAVAVPGERPAVARLPGSPTFQEAVQRLQTYWASVGCAALLPHNTEVGAGTMNPATFLRVLGPEPWSVAYPEPSVRPDDSRYGDNPNRVQRHTQFQARRPGRRAARCAGSGSSRAGGRGHARLPHVRGPLAAQPDARLRRR